MYLENPKGLLMGLSIILLIIFYLLRPKSKEMMLASVMFLTENKATIHRRILGSFNKNMFFYMQLLALSLLTIASANPVIEKTVSVPKENIALILDFSASTGIPETFNKMIKNAEDNLAEKTSIIIAESRPVLILEKGSPSEAREYLKILKPKQTGTNIIEAIRLAVGLNEKEKLDKIKVISDFLTDEDIASAKEEAEKKEISFETIKTENKRDNAGITSFSEEGNKTKITIKNNGKEKKMLINADDKEISLILTENERKDIELEGNFKNIELSKDEFEADDKIIIKKNENKKNSVLIVSNTKNKILGSAIEANDFSARSAKPPIFSTNDKIIIFDDIDYEKLLPQTFEKLKEKIKEGGTVIFNFARQLPKTEIFPAEQMFVENESETRVLFDKNTFKIEELKIKERNVATPKEGTEILATDENNNPLIILKLIGKGTAIYNGIPGRYFEKSPQYPLFWGSLLKLSNIERKKAMYKTGEIINFDGNKKIKTPSGELSSDSILLDEIGEYKTEDGEEFAVNLLNEKESEFRKENDISPNAKIYSTKSEKKTEKANTSKYFMLLGLSVLILEIYLMFRRM